MTGPYQVVSSIPETVTFDHNGDNVTVSHDRCIQEPKRERYELDRQGDAEDIKIPDGKAQVHQLTTTIDDNADDSVSKSHPARTSSVHDHQPTQDAPDDDDLMTTYQVFKHKSDLPINDHSESVLRRDTDPEPADFPDPPIITRIINHIEHTEGTVYHNLQLADSTCRPFAEAYIPQALLDYYAR